MDKIFKLKQLYMEESKHSNYQVLIPELEKLLPIQNLDIKSRFENERMMYIASAIDIKGKTFLDIGGNTGYFTFEMAKKGAKSIDYYEGNIAHAEFVKIASELLHLEDKINIHPQYYLFEQTTKKFDTVMCLNVVHHLCDDFGEAVNKQEAKQRMVDCINQLSRISENLVFQMGYNWCGNKNKCLFEYGIKSEMIDYIKEGTNGYWDIIQIGVAERKGENIQYVDINEGNIIRKDELGEFLNRPIFIMKARRE